MNSARRSVERFQLIEVDEDGTARSRGEFDLGVPDEPTGIEVLTEGGAATVEGAVVRFDHLPGAWVFVPPGLSVRAVAAGDLLGVVAP